MTPEEKAKELVDKFLRLNISQNKEYAPKIAKQCALIAVQELIDAFPCTVKYLGGGNSECIPNLDYWHKVKEAIEKL